MVFRTTKTVLFGFFLGTLMLIGCVDKFRPRKEIRTNCPQGIEPIRKVLFVGWDGVRSDALLMADTPHLDSLLPNSIYSFNVDRGPYTVSTPGWSSILHGVWPDKHGLTENSFKKNLYDEYPDLLTLLRKHNSGLGLATLSNWDAFLQITSEETYAQRFDTDPEMVGDALRILNECPPDVMLLHFDFPDASGHEFGFSPSSLEYLSSIEITDHYLGQLMAKVKEREAQFNEEWMVVLTTDHGGEGTGHGGQDNLQQTRRVWYVVRTPTLMQNLINDGKIVDLMPTMLTWMNCPLSGLTLDGNSLY